MSVPFYNTFGLLVLALGLFRGARGILREGNLWLTEETCLPSRFGQQRTALFLKFPTLVSYTLMTNVCPHCPLFFSQESHFLTTHRKASKTTLCFIPPKQTPRSWVFSIPLKPEPIFLLSSLCTYLSSCFSFEPVLHSPSLSTPLPCLGHDLLLEKSNQHIDWCHHTPGVFKTQLSAYVAP